MQLFYIVLNEREFLGPYNKKEGYERFNKIKQRWDNAKLILINALEIVYEADGDE